MPASAIESDSPASPWLDPLLGAVALLSAAVFVYMVFFQAPTEEQMGIVQKIFYLHVPSAYGMYVGYSVAAVAAILYLWKRSDRADAWSVAGAEIGTLFVVIVLVTGPLWGRKAWGTYWVWDPRLTSTLLTGLIYVSFLSLRSFGQVGETEKRFAAALAVVGFPLLFIIKYSVQRWSGQHPVVVGGGGGGIHPDMVPAFVMGFVFVTALAALLVRVRVGLELSRQALERAEIDAAMGGLLGDDA